MTTDALNHKIQLIGSILGVESCHIATDQDEVRVGSSLDADLVVMDPLVPPLAFVVRRCARQGDDNRPAQSHWIIEAHPRARVFVNDHLTTREAMVFGDTIAAGCHRFIFTAVEAMPRNWKSSTAVSDLCAALLKEIPLPADYMNGRPWHQHLRRLRQAWAGTAALAVLLLLMLLITPRTQEFESIQPPLMVTMLADRTSVPAPDAVRMLGDSKRQVFTPPRGPTTRELINVQRVPVPPLEAEPLKNQGVTPAPTPPRLETTAIAMGNMAPLTTREQAPDMVEITHDRKLPGGAIGRRITLAEAKADAINLTRPQSVVFAETEIKPILGEGVPDAGPRPNDTIAASVVDAGELPHATIQTSAQGPNPKRNTGPLGDSTPVKRVAIAATAKFNDPGKDLGLFQVKGDATSLRQAAAPVETSGSSTAALQQPTPGGTLQGGGQAQSLAMLGSLKPSPLTYEKQGGAQVPIARLPGKLTEMEVQGNDDSIALDGMVTDTEIAMCWKSGQFRANISGNPPPYGDPATYCYVGKADRDGKPHLYISFVCKDSDVGGIRDTYDNVWHGTPTITRDDSVEVFLDFNCDRVDYNQLIVNTSGKYWGQYCPSYQKDGKGTPWDPGPKIKTTISRDSGRWTCEIMIPFDQIGGLPAKGTRWTVNFCRNYRGQTGANSQLQNWFLTYQPDSPSGVPDYFHNPSRFGVFQW